MQRRRVLGAAGSALGAGLAGCTGRLGLSDADSTSTALNTMEVEGAISVATFRWGLQEGVWDERNVDLEFEVGAFGKYNRQVSSGETEIGAPSTVAQLGFMEKGEPLTFVGQQQNMFNRMFARADDDSIEDPSDLGDKVVGLPAAVSSTTSVTHRTLIQEAYGFDVVEDTAETRTAAPPVLWNLLQDGEVDAISEFSGFTIRGIADDSVKTVFDPYEYWMERTDTQLPTTTFTVRRGWYEDNADLTRRFLEGWQAALRSFQENAATALEEYGTEAGITDEDEAEVVRDLMDEGVIFGPTYYDEQRVEGHWEFFELLAEAGEVDLPEKDAAFVTESELGG